MSITYCECVFVALGIECLLLLFIIIIIIIIIFSTPVVEIFLILRRSEHEMIKKRTLVFMYSTGCSCQVLMKLEFSQQILEKYSNIKFHKTDRQTETQDDATRRNMQFCESS